MTVYRRITPWLFICLTHGNWWFRVGRDNGPGIAVCDHRVRRPLFSERYNGQHGIRRKRYLHVGPYCFEFLRRRPAPPVPSDTPKEQR